MNDQTMTAGPGGEAGQAPKPRNKKNLILLLGGIGCFGALALLVLAAVGVIVLRARVAKVEETRQAKAAAAAVLKHDQAAAEAEAAAGPAETSFFGVADKTSKVVYVIDRGGSMADSLMFVKHELKRSIRALRPVDQFQVIFYSSGPARMMPMRQLLPATQANKQTAYEFIDDTIPIGQNDPQDALTQAFRLRPDAIYLLTDGEFDWNIVGYIGKLNADKRIRVNTIGFIYTDGEKLLKEIAAKNGGTYKYVSESDLNALP
ncbi:MAG: VWA domain-containing protein [Planctomycetes bacterium]|nr:VWA domain-containing protein [Planctomycetota bacterium]